MRKLVATLVSLIAGASVLGAVLPPAIVNYQGVLLDNAGGPQNGERDMIFHFYDAVAAGNEILRDRHLLADGKQVSVMMGLFNVQLGTGVIEDGAAVLPNDPYLSLDKVFSDFQAVYLEVEVRVGPAGGAGAFETLSPRTRVVSSPYAMNAATAGSLGGLGAADFINTSASAQIKAGDLTVADLLLNGNDLRFGNGAQANALGGNLFLSGGSLDTSELFLRAGNSGDDGQIILQGQGPIFFRPGNGEYQFLAASGGQLATLDSSRLKINADLTVGGFNLKFDSFGNSGPSLFGVPTGLTITAGLDDTDSIVLNAGNSTDDGRIAINGDGSIELRAGNGFFSFFNGNNVTETAHLDAVGNLQIDADLTVSGEDIFFLSPGARVSATPTGLSMNAGDAVTDSLTLTAGNSLDDGGVSINGDGSTDLWAGNGVFYFINGNTTQTAVLDGVGNLEIHGELRFSGSPGASVGAAPTYLRVNAGDVDTDTLSLTAGNSLDDGGVSIDGNGSIDLWAGNGFFSFINGNTATETASLDASGNFSVDGTLQAGPFIELGGTLAPTVIQHINFLGAHTLNTRTLGDMETRIDNDASSTTEVARWCTNGNCTGANQLMQLQGDGDLLIGGAILQNQFDLAESYRMGEELEPGDVVAIDPTQKGTIVRARSGQPGVLGVVSTNPGVVLGGTPMSADSLEAMWGEGVKRQFLAEKSGLVEERLEAEPDLRAALVTARERISAHRKGKPALSSAHGEKATALVSASEVKDGEEPAQSNDELPDEREMASFESTLETEALERFYARNFAPVALAGRVPVKVDTQYGTIAAGDALAPSPIPGVAMKDDGQGPVIGIALESFSGGRGKVEAFVTRGQGAYPHAAAQTRELADQVEKRTPDPATGIQTLPGNLQIVLDDGGDDEARLSVFRDGDDEQTGAEVFRVDEEGNVFARGSFRPNAMDVAELFDLSEPAEPGDVLAADPDKPGKFRPAREESDPTVIGVVASQPGMLLGAGVDRILAADAALAAQLEEARHANDRQAEGRIWRRLESKFLATHAAVGMTGTVTVKADASYGAIRVGDLLCSSPTPGHAMRSDGHLPGTILGKALEPLDVGTGAVRVLVMLR